MALNATNLAFALQAIEESVIVDAYIANGLPPTIDPATKERIRRKCQDTANAIYAWLLTATVTTPISVQTLHAPGSIQTTGTAVAQANPAPVVGTATGTATGVIS
jgi:hypothetical protein